MTDQGFCAAGPALRAFIEPRQQSASPVAHAGGGDYTVHVVLGIDHRNRMFLLDLWRKQADPKEWVEAYCDLVRKWKPAFWAEEKTQITSGVGPFIEQRSIERQAWTDREQFPTRGDKAV
jgi:hypothetical protein